MHPIINQLLRITETAQLVGIGQEVMRVMLKETLQDYILHAIYSSDRYKQMIFIGGTALRKLHQLPRMSEDLDFTCTTNVDLHVLRSEIDGYFRKIHFDQVSYTVQSSEIVNRLTVKFEVLNELGLSPLADEKIHVKVELTINPKEFPTELTIYNGSSLIIPIRHYPLETMMAGKIVACLNRVWVKGNTGIRVKGRDYYDLIWYMEKGVQPNVSKLLDTNPNYSLKAVFSLLDGRVDLIKPEELLLDLRGYFSDLASTIIWCKNFKSLYYKYRSAYV